LGVWDLRLLSFTDDINIFVSNLVPESGLEDDLYAKLFLGVNYYNYLISELYEPDWFGSVIVLN
jgi:hypothetical protein